MAVWLATIVVWAGILRFAGLDWDEGQHLHPDERFLTMVETALRWPQGNLLAAYFDEARSTLNPRNVGHGFFVYGDFPVVLVKAISILLGRQDYGEVHLVGRAAAACADLGTLLLLFLLARKLYRDERVALLAALLYAMAPLAIQQAHFFVVDNFSAFFATAALYCLARVFAEGRLRDYALAGGCIGLALASKVSLYPIVVLLAVVGGYRLALAWRDAPNRRGQAVERVVVRVVVAGLVMLVAFRVFQPYAFQDPGGLGISISQRWLANMLEARELVSGDRDAPPGHQWTDRAPLLFPLQNLVLWGMGIPLGLTACLAWGAAAWQLASGRRWAHLIPVVWAGLLFAVVGVQWVKSMRYFLPIYPALALLAAWLLVQAWDRAHERRRSRRAPTSRLPAWTPTRAALLLSVVVGGTLLYALAFTSIYTHPHTRVEASRWIFANVPPGTAVANETSWDDGLPLRVDGKDGFAGTYTGLTLGLTDEDSPRKLQRMLDVLEQADYVFVSSNRQYESLTRLPMRFPLVVRYYAALFGGELGFERVADFTSYPRLFGVELPDQAAEEAWTVYDHPRVQLFQKTPAYSRARTEQILVEVDLDAVVRLTPRQAGRAPDALLLAPEDRSVYQAAGTWREMFDPEGVANRFPALAWLLALWLVGVIGLPYVWFAGARLPDRGYAFARPVGLLLVGFLAWWLASSRILPFSRGAIALSLALIGAGALAIALTRRQELVGWLRANRWLLLAEELLFHGFFAAMLLIRWANPDLWHPSRGGEKPMDLAMLNAVVKSAYFPPYDPWFAGGYLNYYYFGFVLVATLTKLTGVVATVAYNLAVPTFFAFLGLAAFGATLALVIRGAAAPVSGRACKFGLLGAAFVAVAGNLAELLLVVKGLRTFNGLLSGQATSGVSAFVEAVRGPATRLLAGERPAFPIEWWYWNATRVIQHPPAEPGVITEMPWFTYLFGDLHAHAMALPYTVVALGLAVSLARPAPAGRTRLADGAHLALLGLVLGALIPMNAWDYPTYALVLLVALVAAGWAGHGASWRPVLAGAFGRWAVVLGLGYLLFLPFHRHYGSPFGGVALWTGSQTGLADYLTVHGFFLFAIVAALLADLFAARDQGGLRLLRLGLGRWRRLGRLRQLLRRLAVPAPRPALTPRLAGMGWLAALALALLGKGTIALIVALLVLVGLLVARQAAGAAEPAELGYAGRGARSSALGFRFPGEQRVLWSMTLALVCLGLGLTLAAELVVPRGIDVGRMNTVFKLYLQVWVLWGIAAAAAVASVHERLPRLQPVWRVLWRNGLVALFAAVLLYPVLATPARIADRFDSSVGPTLDGVAFMEKAVHADRDQKLVLLYDRQAIEWMLATLPGSPVVAEANTAPTLYGWGSRYSVYTGNPTVVGWDWHERQQRSVVGGAIVTRRVEDIQRAYSTADPEDARRIFARYRVEYFVVGQLERAYSPGGQAKWEQGRDSLWELVYENPGTQIYRVLPT